MAISYTGGNYIIEEPMLDYYGMNIDGRMYRRAEDTNELMMIREIENLKSRVEKMERYILDNDIEETICEKVPEKICNEFKSGNCINCIHKFFD